MRSAFYHSALMTVVSAQASRVLWLPSAPSLDVATGRLMEWLAEADGDQPQHIRVPMPMIDPLAWLRCQSAQAGRWYYQARGGDVAGFALAGLGIAASAQTLCEPGVAELLRLTDRSAWCTGPIAYSWRGFDETRHESNSPWGTLAHRGVVVPRVDVRRDGDGWSIGVSLLTGSPSERRATEQLLDGLAPLRAPTAVPQLEVVGDDNPARWADGVERALAAIAAGSLEKVVLARTRRLAPVPTGDGTSRRIDPIDVALALRQEEPLGAVSVLQPDDGPAFVMASPERLYRRRDRIVESHAVAGTCGRGPDPDADERLAERLLRSDKNRREHDLTLQHIEGVLAPLTTECSWQREPRILRLTHVQHLVTELRGALREDVHDDAIIQALHPTPAVCGVPTAAAREFIQQQEWTPRGLYAGVVGVSCGAAGEFSVGIRSAVIDGDSVLAFAGAGIVAGSEADSEWLETSRKLETFDALTRSPRHAT